MPKLSSSPTPYERLPASPILDSQHPRSLSHRHNTPQYRANDNIEAHSHISSHTPSQPRSREVRMVPEPFRWQQDSRSNSERIHHLRDLRVNVLRNGTSTKGHAILVPETQTLFLEAAAERLNMREKATTVWNQRGFEVPSPSPSPSISPSSHSSTLP